MRFFLIGLMLLFWSSQTLAVELKQTSEKPKKKPTPVLTNSLKTITQSKKVITTTKNSIKIKTIKKTVAISNLTGTPALALELDRIVAGQNADVAVYVKSMQKGDTLYTRNIYQPLTPASTLKVLTAEAALLYLGPQYRFTTQLLTDAKEVKNGVLQGNLYIVLSGDPTLTYNDLLDLLISLKSKNIVGIAGNVYIDNTAYDKSFYGPGWVDKDKQSCYGAPISASIINRNCIPIRMEPGKGKDKNAQLVTSNNYFYPTIKNTVVTKSTARCSIRIADNPGSVISIDGCLRRGAETWGISYVIADVPEYNRALFKTLLMRVSVRVYGSVTFGTANKNANLITQHGSQPLRILIRTMLKKSDNIIAGALFKKMGQIYSKNPGSWENGSLAVAHILKKHAGLNTTGLRILDGSGLSPENLTTPAQMMQILDFAYHHYNTSYEFISALPVAGVDGTLKHRMSHIARRVRAKTGTISGVVSLAGYVVTADKEPLAFVIMINGNKGAGWQYKELEDRIATALTRYKRTQLAFFRRR